MDANVTVTSATTQLTQEIIKIAMQHSFIVFEQLTRFYCLIKKRLYVHKIVYQIINNKPHANDIMSHFKWGDRSTAIEIDVHLRIVHKIPTSRCPHWVGSVPGPPKRCAQVQQEVIYGSKRDINNQRNIRNVSLDFQSRCFVFICESR